MPSPSLPQPRLGGSPRRIAFGEERIGFSALLMLLAIFLVYSRSPELLQMVTGIQLPAPIAIVVGLAIISGILSGQNLLKPLLSGATGYYFAFTIWMLICLPLSSWRGGSVEMLRFQWLPAFLSTVVAASLIREERHFHLLAKVVAAASLTITIASLKAGQYSAVDGRFMFMDGSLKNSNDLSVLLCAGLPFFFMPLLGKDWGLLGKLIAIPAITMHVVIVFRTGSRAAMFSLLLLLLLLLLFTTMTQRVTLLIFVGLVTLAGLALTPDLVVARLKSGFGKETAEVAEAVASRRGRTEKLWRSISLTLQHPIFGVGPGVYLSAQAAADAEDGRRPDWLASHNTLTQVSSETGIPGLLLYTIALVTSLVRLQKARRLCARYPFMQSEENITLAFQLSLSGMVVGNLFGSNAYIFFMPMMVALGDKLHEQVMRKFQILQAESAVAAVNPKMNPTILPGPPPPIMPPPRRPMSSYRSQSRPTP